MYGKTINQEIGCDMPSTIHKPELQEIIESLQFAIVRYDDIVCATGAKLQTIKKFNEPVMGGDDVKEKQPESVLEEINRLLSNLTALNNKAQSNLEHLSQII